MKNQPTLEIIKTATERLYQYFTLGQAHKDDPDLFSKWMSERYDELHTALCHGWECPQYLHVETDNGDRALDVLMKFSDGTRFVFEIDLVWVL